MKRIRSILCFPRCSCVKVDIRSQSIGNVQRGVEGRSEHPKTPRRVKGSLGNVFSPTGVSPPPAQLNITERNDQIRREIKKELKNKEAAECLQKAIKNESHLFVEDFLKTSEKKLDNLYSCLRELNGHFVCETGDLSGETSLPAPQVTVGVDTVSLAVLNKLNQPPPPSDGDSSELKLFTLLESEKCLVPLGVSPRVAPSKSSPHLQIALFQDSGTGKDKIAFQEYEEKSMQQKRELTLDDFRIYAVLGKGGFGKVLLAEYKQNERMFAIKALKKENLIARGYVQRLMQEKKILQTVSIGRHPFLVNMFVSLQTQHHACFVMEYAAGGDLHTALYKSAGKFSEPRAMFYSACIVLGLDFLHQHQIVHRDLKLGNIVIDREGFAKITDFGLSKDGMSYRDRTKAVCGTLCYMAPEMLTMAWYTRAIDWWSLGVLMYRMLAGKVPFEGNNKKELSNNIARNKVQCPQHLSSEAKSILKLLLKVNPEERLGGSEEGAADVMKHCFFKNIDWSELLARKMKPPFVPKLRGPKDVSHFAKRYRGAAHEITLPGDPGITPEEQEAFKGFDWVAESTLWKI